MTKQTVLLVEDDPLLLKSVEQALVGEGLEVRKASSVAEALTLFQEKAPGLILLDIVLPDGNGLGLLKELGFRCEGVPIILMTAHASVDRAVAAFRLGAYDFIVKPFRLPELVQKVRNALSHARLRRDIADLRSQLQERYSFGNLVGKSAAMREVYGVIEKVCRTDSTVLIRGESGTGKELVARAIHYNSPRKESPFVAINCAAVPEALLESELFGHEKGAFTGALQRKIGKFERAEGGSLFLDEIGDLPPAAQIKLLRVLQERVIERIGGESAIPIDVRLIAATHQDIEASMKKGRFREDLYYRLNVVPIYLPPLRARQEDIPLLVDHFLRLFSLRVGKRKIAPDVLSLLQRYSWPGNVRELENLVERSMVLSDDEVIRVEDIPIRMEMGESKVNRGIEESLEDGKGFSEIVSEFEKAVLVQALNRTGWVQKRAASLLDMSERSISYLVKKHGLKKNKVRLPASLQDRDGQGSDSSGLPERTK